MSKLNEDISEHANSERRKIRRPDQCLYQPPGGRQKKTGYDGSREESRESSRHEINRKNAGQNKSASEIKYSKDVHELRKDSDHSRYKDYFQIYNNENKKPIISNSSSSRRESDEFKRVFEPMLSVEFDRMPERQATNSSRKTSRTPHREREMKTKNRSLQARKHRKGFNDSEDDEDDENNAWKSFDRSKIKGSMPQTPTRDYSRYAQSKSRSQYDARSESTTPGRRDVYSNGFECETVEKDLIFIHDEDENQETRPKLNDNSKLWGPRGDATSRGLIKLPERSSGLPHVFKRPEPRPRKAVDPEFIRRPVIKEHSKYICLPSNGMGVSENKALKNISSSKDGAASIKGSKSSDLDVGMKEIACQGAKLSNLLQKFAGRDGRNDSNSDRSLSGRRNNPNDARSVSQGSVGSLVFVSDVEVEGLLGEVTEMRRGIGRQLREMILAHPEASIRRGVCDAMWKLGFYMAIEVFRRLSSTTARRQNMSDVFAETTKNALMMTVSEGVEFYESFVKDVQIKYKVNFVDLEDRESIFANSLNIQGSPYSGRLSSEQKFVSIVCYQASINVGDLERYKEVEVIQAAKGSGGGDGKRPPGNGKTEKDVGTQFLSARWWYLKAHQLNFKLGKPFHQLAVISQLMKRRLDAVYFHLRNLHSPKPIESGREELQSIFQGVWSRVSADEKKKKVEAAKRKDRKMKTFKMSGRVEIWIRPNGKKEAMDADDDDEVDENSPEFLSCMDVLSLNRKFLLDYLVTVGRLYTKIGMENYRATALVVLQSFRVLLSSSPLIFSEERLYQLLAINMAVIERHSGNEIICDEVTALSMDMLGLLCECYFRLVGLLDGDSTDNTTPQGSFGTVKELNLITGAIKVFVGWMVGHDKMWNVQASSLLGAFGENKVGLWDYLVEFFNSVGRLARNLSRDSDFGSVAFPEEDFFRGFVPLTGSGDWKVDAQKTYVEDRQLVVARISRLETIIQDFQNLDEPILTFDADTMKYQLRPLDQRKIAAKQNTKNLIIKLGGSQNDSDQVDDDDNDDDVIVVSSDLISADESEDESPAEEPTKVMSERGLELIVKPKYIVLDTNCLVHNFRNVKILLESKMFTLVVPLIVIKELEKLEKRGSVQHHGEDKEFNDWLKVQSGLALEFLRKEFKVGNRHLRAATINGTILNSMAFTNEDYSEAQNSTCCNNDDLILVCCTKICQGPGNEMIPTSPSEPEKKNRNVVLVTNDRVLRIKAFNDEVPSRNVPKFMQWTGLGKK